MVDEREFPLYQEILANPDDRETRLVFADWLEEQSDPRCDFIRYQIQLERMSRFDKGYSTVQSKARKLFKKHGGFGCLSEVVKLKEEYGAGFVESIDTTPTRFIKHAEQIFATAPVRHVRLKGKSKQFTQLASISGMAQLRSLDLVQTKIDTLGFAAIIGVAKGLTRLKLGDHEVAEPMKLLAESGLLESMEDLAMDISAETARILGNHVTRLKKLWTYGLNPASLRELADSSGCASLTTIHEWDPGYEHDGEVRFTEEDLRHFGEAEFDVPMEALRIRPLDSASCRAFECERYRTLTKLSIVKNRVRDEGFILIMRHLPNLVELNLNSCRITDEGLMALAESPLLATLRNLNLSNNRITRRGVDAILQSEFFTKKISLHLTGNQITADEIREYRKERGATFGNFSFLDYERY